MSNKNLLLPYYYVQSPYYYD